MQPSPPTDHDLLRAFVNGDQAAFATLLQRHERMVYSTALRRLNEASDAEDAAQRTFLLLARHASRLKPGTVIGGWLHLTACHQAYTLRRTMQRRRLREHRAALDPSLAPDHTGSAPADPRWTDLAPHLDSALACLPARLRDAIVVCLLENQPRPLAATQLDCTPEALAKRLPRALDKLRELLARRGAVLSAATIAGLLARHGSEAHAAGLAVRVLAAPLAPLPVPLPFATWAARTGLGLAAAGLVVGAILIARRTVPSQETVAPPPAVAASPITPAANITVNLSVSPPAPSVARPALVYGLPSDNPYAPAFAVYASLSEQDRADLQAGQGSSSAALDALEIIVRCFVAGRRSAKVDWGVDDGAPLTEAVDHVAPAFQLANIVGLHADGQPTSAARRDAALDLLAFGRHLSRDGIFLQLHVHYAVTDQALDHLEAILPGLAPAERASLHAVLHSLPPGGTIGTALAREKTLILDKQVSDFESELLTAGVLSPSLSPADIHAASALEAAAPKLPPSSICAWLLAKRPAGSLSEIFEQIERLAAELSSLYAEVAARPEWFADPAYTERRLARLSPLARETATTVLKGIPECLRVQTRLNRFMRGLETPTAP